MKLKLLIGFILFNNLIVAQSIMTTLSSWTNGTNVTSSTINAGVLEITPSGGNFPTINYPISIDGTIYKYVRVLARNRSSYDQIRFRDGVSATATSPATIVSGQTSTDGFKNYYIDLTAFAAWDTATEAGTQIRFSPATLGTGNTSLIEIKEIEFFGGTAVTVWDGTAWSNGTPDATKTAIIASGTFNVAANTSMDRVIVYNGATLNVQSGQTLNITNNIDLLGTGKLIFRTNSSLLQSNATAINSGNIEYRRNSTNMIQYDFTYWSAPVANQVLNVFSPLTLFDKFFSFNAATNNWVAENGANTMQVGKGYAIRAPQTYGSTPTAYNGIFIGLPNNGNYSQSVVDYAAIGSYNLLGNPYPSAIDTSLLFSTSSLNTIYYWTHNTAIASNQFTSNDYATRTSVGGTSATSGGGAPGRYMAAGQGFFGKSSATGSVTFTNAMRVSANNGQFFRSDNNTELSEADDNLLRLDLSNAGGAFKQQLLVYVTGATEGYDSGMDGDQIDGAFVSFYSIIPGHNLAIQAKAMPWSVNDVVPLGFKSTIAANTSFDISISELGVFFADKNVFLEDKVTNVFHDLKAANYTFSSNAGVFENRFAIHYQDLTLSNNEFIGSENSVYVFKNDNQPKIVSTKSNITSVVVYDMLGRIVFSKDNVNAKEVVLSNLTENNQALVIKTTLENNVTVAKKFIF